MMLRPILAVAALAAAVATAPAAVANTPRAASTPHATTPAGPLGAPVAAAGGFPGGLVETVAGAPGGRTFTGWAYDLDTVRTTDAPISVFVTVDGRKITTRGGTVVADVHRPDLARTHPYAVTHGFRTSVVIPAGRHAVCVWAANAPHTPGANRRLGCQTRTFDYSPDGAVQSMKTQPGHVHVAGWAFDSDTPRRPIDVRVSVDATATVVPAARVNPAAATRHPYGGAAHGFAVTVPMPQGTHTVCVTALDVGYGGDRTLRCATLTLAESPIGSFDAAQQHKGQLEVRGWDFDPDAPVTALATVLTVDGTKHVVTANAVRSDVAGQYPRAGSRHGFDQSFTLAEGTHTVCVSAGNLSYGHATSLGCRTTTLDFTPTVVLDPPTATRTGVAVTGWATDPDTRRAIHVDVTVDHVLRPMLVADQKGGPANKHGFAATYDLRSGSHTVCAVAVNSVYGTHNSPRSCRTVVLALGPLARLEHTARAAAPSTALTATGWAFDPDSTGPIDVGVTVDGKAAGTFAARQNRPDVLKAYPSAGTAAHGFTVTVPAGDGEHRMCVTAKNVGGGADKPLGCSVIIAVHPKAPSTVRGVTALAGYGGATITWQAPATDGGAPWTGYTVVSSGGQRLAVAPGATTATVVGLKPKTRYTFTIIATNVAGASPAAVSKAVTTQASPPPQTSPAPVSTSRYIRNVAAATPSDLATMHREGAADAAHNPSGHGYLVLLDIGGQDQYDGGVVLSATAHFVSYANLVADVNAYVDGYRSAQRSSAPVTIAIGTNNDVDVSNASGRAWASRVINPIRAHAAYPGVTIAGADDIEPGFRATYSQTKAWLTGYLTATTAPFVFNGSADGCAWTVTARSCNNGWSMAGLYYLAMGAAPIRSLNLPQVYNPTMAAQWKYISLTGVQGGQPRINFGGPLTEWTACGQAGGCGSLTGRSAWSQLWSNLQSDSRLRVGSLPYSTDLRIDR